MADKKRVLILCTGNSARSQMAEGLLRHDAGDRFNVESAGTKPGTVRPEAIAVMKEVGIDMISNKSKLAFIARVDFTKPFCKSFSMTALRTPALKATF